MPLEIRPEELIPPTPQENWERLRRLGDRRVLKIPPTVIRPPAERRSRKEIFAEIENEVCAARHISDAARRRLWDFENRYLSGARAEILTIAIDRRRMDLQELSEFCGTKADIVLKLVANWRSHGKGRG